VQKEWGRQPVFKIVLCHFTYQLLHRNSESD